MHWIDVSRVRGGGFDRLLSTIWMVNSCCFAGALLLPYSLFIFALSLESFKLRSCRS